MKNLKISQKIIASFSALMLLFISITVYQLYNIHLLGVLQDESYKRAQDAIYAADNANSGVITYQVIADAIINRDESNSTIDWQNDRKVTDEIYEKLFQYF